MAESTFDALTAARDLKVAGFAPDQAEALAGFEGRIYRALWMQGAAIAALILAAKLL